jgi:hypothetical protein
MPYTSATLKCNQYMTVELCVLENNGLSKAICATFCFVLSMGGHAEARDTHAGGIEFSFLQFLNE